MTELLLDTEKKVIPQCAYFGTCGGCSFQDLDYDAQLELKRKQVEEVICRGGFETRPYFQVQPAIPSPKPYHYRHMMALSVKKRHGALHLGFVGQDRRTFLPVDACPIADERISGFFPEALKRLEALPEKRRFRTSQIVLRVGSEGEVITSLRSDRGRMLECAVSGKTFSYAVSSFFQHNFSILESFIQTVHDLLNPNGSGILFDLYSGVGLLGISLAAGYERVVGIEEGYEAVQCAKRNAQRNAIINTDFLEGKVEVLLPELISAAGNGPLHVIVDPPRAGLKPEVLECLNRLPIKKLLYVSCHLEALRRDLEVLSQKFQIVQVQPMDFFPQTRHIETLVLLEPRL